MKYTTLNDIKVWCACTQVQIEELQARNQKLKGTEIKKEKQELCANNKHIQLLTGMQMAFMMILENETEIDGEDNGK